MKVIRKYVPIRLEETLSDREFIAKLSYGGENDYGRIYNPKRYFDTDEEAIEHAYKTSAYSEWVILPVIRFDNWENI